MIELSHINKTFRVARRNAGLSAAFRALLHKEYTQGRRCRMYLSRSRMGKWLDTLAQTAQGRAAPSR